MVIARYLELRQLVARSNSHSSIISEKSLSSHIRRRLSLTNELAAGARKSLIGSKKKTNNLSEDILNSRSSSRKSKWIGTGKNGNCGKLFAFSPFCALFDRRKRKAQGRRSVEIEM